jgi:hypothetical protein
VGIDKYRASLPKWAPAFAGMAAFFSPPEVECEPEIETEFETEFDLIVRK